MIFFNTNIKNFLINKKLINFTKKIDYDILTNSAKCSRFTATIITTSSPCTGYEKLPYWELAKSGGVIVIILAVLLLIAIYIF